jgi:hypothetical protein
MAYRFIILLSVLLLFSAGCGEKTLPGMPKRYPATLTVIQDGHPLADAEVMLINVDPSINWSGGGNTDKDGVVHLRTLGQYTGIPEGTYKVGVTKTEYPTDIIVPAETPSGNKAVMDEYNRLVKKYNDNTFVVVEPKFAIETSTLQVTISKKELHVTVDVSPAIRVKYVPPPQG